MVKHNGEKLPQYDVMLRVQSFKYHVMDELLKK